jgi:hypothetical protein
MLGNKKVILLTILLLSACSVAENNTTVRSVSITVAFPELSFNRPVDLQDAPNDSDMLYVVEQAGRIYSFYNSEHILEKTLFLNITDRVNNWGNKAVITDGT